jgi:hypothetical protein
MKHNLDFLARVRRALSALLFTTPFLFAAGLSAQNAVTDWNTIASTTIVKNGGKSPGASSVWFAYSSLAVYDAVNAISHQYSPPDKFCISP